MDDSRTTSDQALLLMLTPMVRFWIRRGEKLQRFMDLLKLAFIQAAREEIERSGEKVTVSKLSCVSGVHRTDTAAIFKQAAEPPQFIPSVVKRVIGLWEQGDDFRTIDGKPKVLEYPEFERLVSRVSKSIGPRSVLFELQRSGAVESVRTGYKLVYASLKHTKNFDRAINLVARNTETMLESAEENMAGTHSVPNLVLRTEFDSIFIEDIPKIRVWLEREGKKFHRRARDFISRFDSDLSPTEGRVAGGRVVLGSFSRTEILAGSPLADQIVSPAKQKGSKVIESPERRSK